MTDPSSGRVFRIKEIPEETSEPALPASTPSATPALSPAPSTAPSSSPSRTIQGAPPPAVQVKRAPIKVTGKFRTNLGEELEIAQTKEAGPTIGRNKPPPAKPIEDVFGELFEAAHRIFDIRDLKKASQFILDLALKTIHADSGSTLIADIDADDLYFAAARGPKADDVLSFRVPMGQGIVGFCAQEGVSLAISDVQKNPYFYAAISKSIGYDTKSILCSPAQHNGRVYGALELINKAGGTSFSNDEINVLNYLAHEFAEYLALMSE